MDERELELNNLKEEFEGLSQKIDVIEQNNNELRENIRSITQGFEEINKNMDILINKINSISKEDIKEDKKTVPNFSVKRGLRKAAVSTVGAIFSVADKINEKTNRFREGFEDLIAEAQYENRKKRMQPQQSEL